MPAAFPPRTEGEIESFIITLRAACSDETVHRRLDGLLSMPEARRKAVVRAWVNNLLIEGAPREFVQTIGCLLDDRVAQRAQEEIQRARREP